MEEISKLHLSSNCIIKFPLQAYCNDFTFIVNGEEYKTSRIISDLLSPKICQIHSIDPTFNQIFINTEKKGDFSLILKLINFKDISIPNNQIDFFYEIIEWLGNEFYDFKTPDESAKITDDNIFSLIKKHGKFSKFFSKNLSAEIEYIASHFFEICINHKEDLASLDEQILSKIFCHSNLKLKDEDQFLTFVNDLYRTNTKFCFLYKFVIFSNVSSESITEFINIFDYNDIDSNIWHSISSRLIEKVQIQEEESTRYIEQSKQNIFEYKEGKEFNGIIRFLTNKFGKNISDCDVVKVTSNYPSKSSPPKNLLDFDQDNLFLSDTGKKPYTWICYDFKNYEIQISSYSIKSGPAGGYVRSWVIEISNDGENWFKIDEQSNYSGLNEPNSIKTFDVHSSSFARFCRFRHTGEYYVIGNCIRIHSIEFYGSIKEII